MNRFLSLVDSSPRLRKSSATYPRIAPLFFQHRLEGIRVRILDPVRPRTRSAQLPHEKLHVLVTERKGCQFVTVSPEPTTPVGTPSSHSDCEPEELDSQESPSPLSRTPTPSPTPQDTTAMSSAKVNKPPVFTGKDLSLMTVNTWIRRVKAYVRKVEDDEEKVEIASTYLESTAEQWYSAKYGSAATPPQFETFLTDFRTHFARGDDGRLLRQQLENTKQGDRSAVEYHAEFSMIVDQIGANCDMIWAADKFVWGLHPEIQRQVGPNISKEDTIEMIAEKAQRAYEFYILFDKPKSRQPSSSGMGSSGCRNTRPSSHPVHSAAAKLSAKERKEHMEKGQCFLCHRQGHVVGPDYPKWEDRKSDENGTKKSQVKTEVSDEMQLVVEGSESELESEYLSAPTIQIPIKLGKVKTTALIDDGSSVNLVSPKVVAEGNLPTMPSPHLFRVGQAFSHETELLKDLVKAHVEIPAKEWKSSKPGAFLIAPLKRSKVVLGRPWLKQEKIVVDCAADDIIVPRATKTSQPKRYIRYGGPKVIRTAGLFPKVSPAVKDQKPHQPTIEIVHSINETEWQPFIHPEVAQWYHDEVVAEFPDVFGDNLPP